MFSRTKCAQFDARWKKQQQQQHTELKATKKKLYKQFTNKWKFCDGNTFSAFTYYYLQRRAHNIIFFTICVLLCLVFLYVLLFILSAMPPCLLCTSTRLELLGSKTIDTIVLFIICYILIFVISFSFVAQWIFMFSISFESESGARGCLAHLMNLTIECQFLMRKFQFISK